MAKVYNWGIIGLGKIARKFADDLKRVPNARLHAVASTSSERAKAFALEYKVMNFYGSYEAMLSCPNLDVVYIATPHIKHCENTLMCLEHKIPVLCEKPFAMNATEVKRMITLAKFQKTFLMEALWTRFLPTIDKVLSLIKSGTIGEVISVEADFGFRSTFDPQSRLFNQDKGGGSLLDVGIYPVFLSLLILGKPENIKASACIGSTNVDESCAMILKYANNKVAVLHSSIVTKTKSEAYIYGEKGYIRINSRWHEPTSLTLQLNDSEPQDFFFDFDNRGYAYEIREVIRCLGRRQKESKLMSLDFSLDLIELLDAIRMKAGIYYPRTDYPDPKPLVEDDTKFSMN